MRKFFVIILILFLLIPFAYHANAQVSSVINIQSFDVEVNPKTNKIYATNAPDSLSVIDGSTNAIIKTINLMGEARAIAINQDTNKIYVTNRITNEVHVINGATDALEATIPISQSYVGLGEIAVNIVMNKIYACGENSDSVYVIDGATNSLLSTIPVGKTPTSIVASPILNFMFVGLGGAHFVVSIDCSKDKVTITNSRYGSSVVLGVDPVTYKIYIADGQTKKIDHLTSGADNNVLASSLLTGGIPTGIAVDNTLNYVYVISSVTEAPIVTVLQGGSLSKITNFPIGGKQGFYNIAANPITNKAYIAGNTTRGIFVIDGNNLSQQGSSSSSSSSSGSTSEPFTIPECKFSNNSSNFLSQVTENDFENSEIDPEEDSNSESLFSIDSVLSDLSSIKGNITLEFSKVLNRSLSSVANKIKKSIKLITNARDAARDNDADVCSENITDGIDQLDFAISLLEKKQCKTKSKNLQSCISPTIVEKYISNIEDLFNSLEENLLIDEDQDGIADACLSSEFKSSKEPTNNNSNTESTLSTPIKDQFILKFKASEKDPSQIASELASKYGLQILHVYKHVFNGAAAIVPPGKEKTLLEEQNIKEVIQDYTIFPANNLTYQTDKTTRYLVNDQVLTTGINWIDAELNPNEGDGCMVTVAVLDTGIDFSHPDLDANINTNLSVNCTTPSATQACVSGGQDDYTIGIRGHGTAVAGIIAAEDNNIGVLGVGSKIELVSVKVLPNGNGSFGDVIAGLDYVTQNADIIEIANLSLAATFSSYHPIIKIVQEAIQKTINSGVICVVAAGNSGVDVTQSLVVPAMFPEVITVSALYDTNGEQDKEDNWGIWKYGSSNYGSEIDIIAPGSFITTTALGGDYLVSDGTSFATPFVSGTIGLYIAKNGRPSNADARSLTPLIDAISKPRSGYYTNEPVDGEYEPACYANGPRL
ncbi:MAG: hypothetical protein A3I68_06490 [Candidatus Melainabacteria bacterium RIFCSPLOWO2_02_FULL_35_15]|nr:MAG: hypothetical protein A3F80_00010 [Candidatus Melainabacteria bacterium RIFCSPLOWO2_12_FULL_35_11]OGI13584.1 MAG: hypothetical protein A3I68_06490 [Candidatus Melainabacteria bacterium RIFCSPLOWO2_02_FULL_35_15]